MTNCTCKSLPEPPSDICPTHGEKEVWYRYDYISLNDGRVDLWLRTFPVVRRTPKGVWVKPEYEPKKFILTNAHKRYACPTKDEALESFIKRKEKQLRLLSAQVKNIESALALAKTGKHPETTKDFVELFDV